MVAHAGGQQHDDRQRHEHEEESDQRKREPRFAEPQRSRGPALASASAPAGLSRPACMPSVRSGSDTRHAGRAAESSRGGSGSQRWTATPLRLGKSWLALPLVAFFLMFVALPVVMLLAASVSDHGAFTLSNFERFFSDGLSVPVLGRTLLLGLETAAVTLMLGYPLALLFVGASPGFQKLLILLIIQPLLTSAVVRTFAWVVILGRQGLINETLLVLGLTKGPIALLYT